VGVGRCAANDIEPGPIAYIQGWGFCQKQSQRYPVEYKRLGRVQSLIFKAGDFVRSKANATQLLNYPLGGQNIVTDDEITDAFNEMMNSRQRAYGRILDTIGLVRKVRMNDDEIYSVLDAGGLSKQDVRYLLEGEVPDWKPSKTFLQAARERADQTSSKRRKETIEADFERRINLVYKLLEEYYAREDMVTRH